jgi:cytochrome c5
MKKSLLCAGLIASVSITGICSAENKPAVDGASLLEQRCSVCHPSSRPKGVKKTAEQWETTVTRMMGKGAKLSADEKKLLVTHLAKTYKP